MSLPRILLFGKVGQVAWELRRALAPVGELTCAGHDDVDLAEPASIRQRIRDAAPAIIVNAAAYTAVDKAENEPDRAMQINAKAPGIMAEEAKRLGATLVHYSTDYVFDGAKTTPYTEEDASSPLGAYGRSKAAGDAAIHAVDCNHLIFRLCWVYGARGANFLLTMQRLARERETLRVVHDQYGSPTPSRLIAETTALALRHVDTAAKAGALKGVYHLCSSGHTSWHGFASAIVAAMPEAERKCRTIEAITTPEYPTPAKRPAYTVMSCARLERAFGLRLPDWKHGLHLTMEQ